MLYNLFIAFLRTAFAAAALLQPKARAFVSGRKNIFKKLEQTFAHHTAPVIWIHCASLGEFEQGRTLMEAVKMQLPDHKILLTFFSPSGYEVRKNFAFADFVFYLPWDTQQNALRFISITKPVLAIFIKYEFWYHYSVMLKKHNVPLLSVSSIFRKNQLFFKSYGGFYREILKNFTYFFVQNDTSVSLLRSIGIDNCRRAGDTRFDRVVSLTQEKVDLPIVEKFKDGQRTWVIGSCWPEDIAVLAPLINESENKLKFVIAPHEISESFLSSIKKLIQLKTVRFSHAANVSDIAQYDVLLVDNIGMLSKLYRYGEFAYVGGAFGKGLHNILEPACYGIPVFFGDKKYEKFQEAVDLIMRGGAFEVSGYTDLRSKYELLVSRPENYLLACEVTSLYIQENIGATNVVMEYCKKLLRA